MFKESKLLSDSSLGPFSENPFSQKTKQGSDYYEIRISFDILDLLEFNINL